jgi:hypothetical protein
MNTAKILKRAPTLILIVCLAYACYRIHAILPDSGGGRDELARGLDVMVKDVLEAGADEVRALASDALRDPFRIGLKPAQSRKAADVTTNDPELDPLAGFVHSLSLDATFLQGKTQIAIINGRMYHQGQHLVVQDEGERALSPLFVQNVQVHRVTLIAHNTSYELGYPDQLGSPPADRRPAGAASADGSVAEIDPEGELAFYKKLLNSPLGKLGKSLTGSKGVGAPASEAGRSRRPGRPRGGAGAGGP